MSRAMQWIAAIATAVLVTGVAPAPTAGAAAPLAPAPVTGLESRSAVSPHNSVDVKSVQATCPDGKRIVGGSAVANADTGVSVRITNQFPSFDLFTGLPSFFAVTATEEEVGSTGNWSLGVVVLCANPLPGQVMASGTSIRSSDNNQSVTATCPDGKQVLGGFASIHDGANQVILDDVVPNAALTSVTAKAYEDQTGFAGTWYLVAYAICADPVLGLVRAPPKTSDYDSVANKGYTIAPCPDARRAISVSGAINDGFGQVQPIASFIGGTYGAFMANEDRNGYSGNWSQTTYTICVT